MANMTSEQIAAELLHFTGSETLYRHGLNRNFLYTEGVQWLAENTGAYWLIDAIASNQSVALRDPMLKDMQFWTLKKQQDGSWLLFCERDTNDVAIRQDIEFSDFPLLEIKLWVGLSGDHKWTLMLPSEY